jgi:hypothetical protein
MVEKKRKLKNRNHKTISHLQFIEFFFTTTTKQRNKNKKGRRKRRGKTIQENEEKILY